MFDFARTLLGIRKKRRPLPTGLTPKPGTTIVRENVKIRIDQPITQELWDWMLLSGWRVNPVLKDRRHYAALPQNALQQLLVTQSEMRAKVHDRLINSAQRRA